jgi:DNA-binding CsgD family transcriptional regulator/tetratricopeptide (TPR) repeat protein
VSTSTLSLATDILGGMPPRVSAAVMVGREAPLRALDKAYDAARAGDGRLVVVGGEAGAGKTRLVTEFLERAEGATRLVGGCLELGQAVMPLAPVAGILRQLARDLGDDQLADLTGPELAAFLPGHRDAPPDPQWIGQAGMFEAFRSLLDQFAEKSPVVLVVEDLHWADRSTLDLVTWLARTLPESRILLVATYRSDEMRRSHPLRPVLAELSRLSHVERVDLPPLDAQEIVELLTAINGGPVSPDVARQVADRSEGNPFFAEELFAAAGDQGVPLTVRDILSARLDALPEPAKEVLRIAAAAGRRVDHRLLEVVASLDPGDLEVGLRAAVDGQALVPDADGYGYRFRHALLQEAVHDQLLPGERTRLHRAFADALLEEPELAAGGADSVDAELAHHARAAHDVDLAFGSLVRAGQRAEALFAFNEAQHHFEAAAELRAHLSEAVARSAPASWELLRAVARSSRYSGEPQAGIAHLRKAISLLDPVRDRILIGGLHAELSEICWLAGRGDDGLAASQTATEMLADERTREAAGAFGWHSRMLMLLGRFEEAVPPGRLGVALASELHAPLELCRAENSLGTSLASLGEMAEGTALLRDAIDVAEAAGVRSEVIRGYINLTSVKVTPGNDIEGAEEAMLEGLAYASRHDIHGGVTDWLRMELADLYSRTGRLRQAESALGEIRAGWVAGVNGWYFHTCTAWLHAVQGRLDDAAEHLRLAHEAAPHIRDPQALGPLTGVRLLLDLARGNLDVGDALEVLEPFSGDPSTYNGLALIARVSAAAAEAGSVEAAERVGRIRAIFAARLEKSNDVLAANLAGWIALLDAEHAAVVGRPDPDLWRHAREVLDARGQAEQSLYCGVRLAAALAATGDPTGAAEAAADARARARDQGYAALAEQLDSVIRKHRIKLGVGAPSGRGLGGLTSRESEVLTLLAEGRTNREIGGALFITEKTASVHVSNILAKLGVGNRGEAAAMARELRP